MTKTTIINKAQKHARRISPGQPYFDEDEFEIIVAAFAPLGIVKIDNNEECALVTLKSGDSVTISDKAVSFKSNPSNQTIAAAVDWIKKAGWTSVEAHGSEDFKLRAWAYLVAAGVKVVNYTPEGPAKARADALLAQIMAEQAQPAPAGSPHQKRTPEGPRLAA